MALLPSWRSAKLRHKNLPGQLILSKQNAGGRRKLAVVSKKKRIARNASGKPKCYAISSRNRNVKRRGKQRKNRSAWRS
jgi:hypothetical protein